jgi:2-keto-4-pentenoate hydratase/2-oxohepta-3-ene-1,7-dioic acid hydratase in catechol pathway
MRLVSYVGGFGRVEGAHVVPMGRNIEEYLLDPTLTDATAEPVLLSELEVLAPVPRPGKIICIGLNYRDHAKEADLDLSEQPILFAKFANSVVGPGARVEIPPEAAQVDYEAELGVVIGRRACRVPAGNALDYVAGYTCCNDVSARDLQFAVSQWTRGKAIDTFLPMGPVLCTRDEIADPQALGIRCTVNGELRQSSSTSQMIFGVAELIAFLSRTMTLEPGDVIATGTPPGVGMAFDPPRWLSPGDEVAVEIDSVGILVNEVVAG